MPSGNDSEEFELLEASARHFTDAGIPRPEIALILGSGMGAIAGAMDAAVGVPTVGTGPLNRVAASAGRVLIGRLEQTSCIVFPDRPHVYEGKSFAQAGFPVRLAHRLGARCLIALNAAGGIADDLLPGRFMLLSGHLSLQPLPSPSGSRARHGDPYETDTSRLVAAAALRVRIPMRRGIYAWMQGPNYETPAEIQALRRIGADAVGMSTVPEIVQGHALGIPCAAVSLITNRAAGLCDQALDHGDVLAFAMRATRQLEQLLREFARLRRG